MAASDFSGNLQIFRRIFFLRISISEITVNISYNVFYENVLVCSTNVLLINVLFYLGVMTILFYLRTRLSFLFFLIFKIF